MLLRPTQLEPRQRICALVLVVDYRAHVLQRHAGLVDEVTDSRKAIELRRLRLLGIIELKCGLVLRDLLWMLGGLERTLVCVEGRLHGRAAVPLLVVFSRQVRSVRHQLVILGLQNGLLVRHCG